jgi:hypothetical protein
MYAVRLPAISALIASELSSAPPLDVVALATAIGLFSINNKFPASMTLKACCRKTRQSSSVCGLRSSMPLIVLTEETEFQTKSILVITGCRWNKNKQPRYHQ